MVISFVQATSFLLNSASSGNATLTGVAAGATVALIVTKVNTTARAYSVTDSASGTYDQRVLNDANSGRQVGIWTLSNRPAGDLTVTLTVTGGFNIMAECTIVELANVDNSDPFGDDDEIDNGNTASGGNLFCAAATGFNPPAGSIVLAGVCTSAVLTSIAANSPYVGLREVPSVASSGGAAHLYRTVASNLTNERPSVTFTSAAVRTGPGACIWLKPAPDNNALQSSIAHHMRYHG